MKFCVDDKSILHAGVAVSRSVYTTVVSREVSLLIWSLNGPLVAYLHAPDVDIKIR